MSTFQLQHERVRSYRLRNATLSQVHNFQRGLYFSGLMLLLKPKPKNLVVGRPQDGPEERKVQDAATNLKLNRF